MAMWTVARRALQWVGFLLVHRTEDRYMNIVVIKPKLRRQLEKLLGHRNIN
jgi:hypothetical protein